jgi:hypothetical protein
MPRRFPFTVLAGILLAACDSPTDVDPLTISLRIVTFATQEEFAAWPQPPVVVGGADLVVRGWAHVGCGRPEADAQKRDNVVGVEVRAVDTDRICPAVISSSSPVEVTVSGLAPGTYRVRVGMAGHTERTEGTATIAAP